MSSGTYISSPGVLNTSPTDTTVYLLSSINDVGAEIIIRDVAPLTTGRVVVSTTNDIYFNRDLCGAALLSSFTITQPFDYITVASRTPREYMLLQASTTPTRADNQAFAPNFLQISSLSTLATVASSNATLGNLALGGPILKDPTADTRLAFSTITATAYLSTGLALISTAQTVDTVANQINTTAAATSYSAYTGIFSTLHDYTVTNTLAIGGSLLQTGDLKVLGAAGTTVGGTAWFGSTLQANTARVALNTAFGSSLSLISSLTLADTLSTLTTWSSAGAFYTSNYTALNNISTSSYNAGQTINTGKTYIGGSNAVPPTTATTTVTGSTYVDSMWITPFTSTNTVSTVSGTVSSINFINNLGAQVRMRGAGTNIAINEVVIGGGSLAPFLSTVTTSNWVSTAQYITSTLQHATAATAPYTYDMRGDAFISTALIADTLAIYDGTNAAAFTNPTNNTIYLSTNGMLINNRLFIDHLQNRVGVNTVNPQYTLDVSGLIYHTSSIAYNVGGGSSWVVVSDSAAKENIVADINYDPYKEMIQNLKLKEYTYSDVPEETTVSIPITEGTEENPTITGYYDVSQIIQPGFASQYGLQDHREYGFIAQDVEFYFPNAVYEAPFYKYADFRFLNVDQIMKAHYAITRSMLQTVKTHNRIIGHRRDFISTATGYQNLILADLSANVGTPFNIINPPPSYPTVADWQAPFHTIIDSSANLTTAPNIQVTWSLGTGASAPKYRIYYKPAESTTYNAITITDPTARSYDLSANFVHSSSYDIFVATVNILDAESAGTIYSIPFYYPPTQPSAVTAIPATNTSLTITWTVPAYIPQYYSVSWSTGNPADISGTISNIPGTQTSYTIPRVTLDVLYTVTIKSVTATLISAPATTTATVESPPDPPSSVTITYIDYGFTVTWTASPSPGVTSYSVFYKLSSASSYTELMGQTSPINITGLTDLADYNIYVVAFKNTLQGTPSTTGTYRAYSFPIMNTVTTVTPSNQQLALGFTTSNLTGGTFQYFKIYNSNGTLYASDITGTVLNGNASGTRTISGLVNGTTYNYKVSVVTTEGDPAITQESALIDISGIPFTNPVLTSGGTVSGNLSVSYTVNATTYGGTIKEYRRYANNAVTSSVGPLQTITTTANSATFTVTGLTNGTAYPYDFYVVVENRGSTLMSAVQKISGTPYTVPTITGTPTTSVSTTNTSDAGKLTIGATGITVSNTGGSPIIRYKIYIYSSGTLVNTIETDTASYGITLSGLLVGFYTVKISAINAAGESNLSNLSTPGVTVWNVPAAKTAITASYTPAFGSLSGTINVTHDFDLCGNNSIISYTLYKFDNSVVGSKTFTSLAGNLGYTSPSNVNIGETYTLYLRPSFRRVALGTTYTPTISDSDTYRITNDIAIKNWPAVYTSGNLPTFSSLGNGICQISNFQLVYNGGDPITSYIIYANTTTDGTSFTTANISKSYNASEIYDNATFDMKLHDTTYNTRAYKIYKFRIRAFNSVAGQTAALPAVVSPAISFG